jgi:hypothetical protein
VRAARQRAAGLRHLHVHLRAPRQALTRKQRAKRAEWTHRLRTRSAKKVAAPFRVQITMSCVEGPFSKVKCLVYLLNKDTVERALLRMCAGFAGVVYELEISLPSSATRVFSISSVNSTSSISSGDMNAGNLTSVLAGILRRGVVCGAVLSECSVAEATRFRSKGVVDK